VALILQRGVRVTFDRAAEGVAADELGELSRILSKEDADVLDALRTEAEDEWNEGLSFRVLDADGRVHFETPAMAGKGLDRAVFPAAAVRARGSGIPFESPTGEVFRVFAFDLEAAGARFVVQLAVDRTSEDRMLRSYEGMLWATVIPAALLAILVGHAIATRGLEPIRDMAERVRRVGASRLDERIEAAAYPEDLRSFAVSFNEMLGRLDEAFLRLSRFSADIAHELRTPLANLRAELEVTLVRPRSPEEYRDVVGSALEECERLSRLIEDLLFLARAEVPAAAVRRQPVDVAGELGRLKDLYQPFADERGVRLEVEAPGGAVGEVDRTLFQRAATNLVDNAIRHTGEGGHVTVSCRLGEGVLELEVADTGSGIPAEDVPQVFDRLHRVDSSRSGATGGAGLGLAIVKSVADLHGGSVTLESELGRGTRVRLTLPS
jgi:two-component system, OmpR family, heavy metal sensor histidine kinase CusS